MNNGVPAIADLHMHSVFSDGLNQPTELVKMAAERKLRYIALTDHDTVAGSHIYEDAVAEHNLQHPEMKMQAIRGIELSTGKEGRLHMLGYGVDEDNPVLKALIKQNADERIERAEKALAILPSLGIRLSEESEMNIRKNHRVGRMQIARAMMETGVVMSINEAFTKWLAEGKPAYIPRKTLDPVKAIEIIRGANGVAVLAHPMRIALEDNARRALIYHLADNGLQGLEVYHPSAACGYVHQLHAMAKQRNLLITGGSDYHGDKNSDRQLGCLPEHWQNAECDVQKLLETIEDSRKNCGM